MRTLLCLLIAAAFFVPSPEAEACSCIQPSVQAWPENESVVATNAHIFVRFPPTGMGSPKTTQQKVIVRLAGSQDTDGLPAARVDVVSEQVRFVELSPLVKLAPGARFEVVIGSGKNTRVVSTFVVGSKANKTVPSMPKIKLLKYVHQEAVCCMCSSGRPHILVDLKEDKPEDNTELLFGVWAANAQGKVDWKGEPDAYVVSRYGGLSLGNSSTCSANNYPVPETGTIAFGLRQVSRAGKWGKGKILRVKATLKKPRSLMGKQSKSK